MNKKESQAGTKAEQSKNAEVTTSSPACTKPTVVRSPKSTQSSKKKMSLEEIQEHKKKYGYGRTIHNKEGKIIGSIYVPPNPIK